ncbi:MAG: ATP-dependent helicase HrpB [Actinomycetes bacterium]
MSPLRIPEHVRDLPVAAVLDDVAAAVRQHGRVVVEAPAGAGKTTLVPLALAAALESEGRDGRVVVLEPRRVAARAAARRMAALVGDRLGGVVGVTTRDDRRTSAATRVEVVTEGVLVRRLQRDPSLAGVACVVLDEFHERSLEADLGLAFSADVAALRDDLALVVMSATLDGARVRDLLDAPAVRSDGRLHPVEVVHVGPSVPPGGRRSEVAPPVADAVLEALAAGPEGDVLVFLPGAREIRWVGEALEGRTPPDVVVTPLHGSLPPDAQDAAIAPAATGTRKVVLSTDVAESSLTIEGVTCVVDAGLAREPRFDPTSGMSRLVTVRVSRDRADQRAGRAGRVRPGRCVRLWPEREHAGLAAHRTPALAQEDLAGFALEVADWGADVDDLLLLDRPPAAAWAQATALLADLDALDGDGRITDHGRRLADLPTHPRLAHMVLAAGERAGLACDLAALLADRDVVTTDRDVSVADLATRVRLLRGDVAGAGPGTQVSRGALRRARDEARRLRRAAAALTGQDLGDRPGDLDAVGRVLVLAYPDRVARRRGDGRGRFVLAGGRGAVLPEADVLAGEDLLVVASVDAGERDARVHLAAGVDEADLRDVLGHHLVREQHVAWDDAAGDVAAVRRERLGALVLAEGHLDDPDPDAVAAALVTGIRRRGLHLLPWDRDTRDLVARAGFLHHHLADQGWPAMDDDALLAELERWLVPFLAGVRRVGHLGRVPLRDALAGRIGWERVRRLDELAPTHLEVPSGSRVRLTWDPVEGPVLPVKLQELFGATQTPTVADGRVPVTVHLLSPARRPVQVTTDLAGFWERGYPEVRAELRGRYPKHPWPEDPSTAVPTARTTRRA